MVHFEIYRVIRGTKIGQYRWRLRAGNGEIVAHGEAYKDKKHCIDTVQLIQDTTRETVTDFLANSASKPAVPSYS